MIKKREKLKSVLLLDDNSATNYIHRLYIIELGCAEEVLDFQSGKNALTYLRQEGIVHPNMILVDINMPIMSAWEFLAEYEKIEYAKRRETVIFLLSTSLSPADKEKANSIPIIHNVLLKPLSVELIQDVVCEHFPNSS